MSIPGKISKREALVDTAKALLWERGFEAMSPRAVLEHSGAGQGSLYHHFKGKRELAAAALEEVQADALANLEIRLSDAADPLKRIETYLDAPREALKGCKFGRLANEQTVFDPVLGPIIESFFTKLEDHLTRAIKEAQKADQLPAKLKPRKVARMLVATVQGGYVLSRVHKDPKAMTDAIKGAKCLLGINASPSSDDTDPDD